LIYFNPIKSKNLRKKMEL